MDTGPIIMQGVVPVENDDTVDSLKAKVQSLEKKLYPEAIALFSQGKIRVEGRRTIVG